MFSTHKRALKNKAGIFKFVRFIELLRKAPFSKRISMCSTPYPRNKAEYLRTMEGTLI